MLSYTIAMPATISTSAIMDMAPLMSTTKEFAENSCNSMTSGNAASTTTTRNNKWKRRG